MALTGKLGTPDSKLGNILFGRGASATNFNETPNNTLVLTQVVARENTLHPTASNTLSLTQTIHIGHGRSVTSILSLTGTLANNDTLNVANTLVASLVQQVVLSVIRTLGVNQSLSLSQVVGETHAMNLSASNTLVLSQADTHSQTEIVSQSLTLTQIVSSTLALGSNNALVLTQSATLTQGFAEHPSNTIALTQTAGVHRTITQSVVSIWAPSQFLESSKVFTLTASNTLVLAQDLVRDRTLETMNQAVTLVGTATVSKLKIVNVLQALTLSSQTPSLPKATINLSVIHTLTFKQQHDRPTGISSYPIVTIPSGYVVKVPDVRPPDPCYLYRGTLTLLEIQGLSVILPTAEFNDSQSYNGRVNIKRAMNGRRRVYHRKMGIAQKLHYDFIIDRRKAIELRQFLIQANSVPIKLTNWKGEVWQVLLTNNPLTFTEESYWGPGATQSSGNKSSISLEFEGARIN